MLQKSAQNGRAPQSERGNDCYDTPPEAVRALLTAENIPQTVWEPCAGAGNIVNVLRETGRVVFASDIEDRGCEDCSIWDFFNTRVKFPYTIITNPPYFLAEKFVKKALEVAPSTILLLRLAFLESQRRSDILENGKLARIHIFRNRLPRMHRAGWVGKKSSSSIAFAWFVWDREHQGPTTIHRLSW